ncbi:MAG TPA: hypothetical protein VN213_21880 [Solirubrobacteraceae bacterium]|nr:hypothetical protein [Solirubrobacteraceae bacterium]
MSLPALVGLAALGVPRVVAHDLGVGGDASSAVLAIGPFAVWLVVLVRLRRGSVIGTALALGGLYGLALAVTHQILWEEAFDGREPRLGDRLADLPDWAHAAITRGAGFASSIATGLAIGAVLGAVATVVRKRSNGRPVARR